LSSCPLFYCSLSFFFQCFVDHRYLHSFPTRRSSDLSSSSSGLNSSIVYTSSVVKNLKSLNSNSSSSSSLSFSSSVSSSSFSSLLLFSSTSSSIFSSRSLSSPVFSSSDFSSSFSSINLSVPTKTRLSSFTLDVTDTTSSFPSYTATLL